MKIVNLLVYCQENPRVFQAWLVARSEAGLSIGQPRCDQGCALALWLKTLGAKGVTVCEDTAFFTWKKQRVEERVGGWMRKFIRAFDEIAMPESLTALGYRGAADWNEQWAMLFTQGFIFRGDLAVVAAIEGYISRAALAAFEVAMTGVPPRGEALVIPGLAAGQALNEALAVVRALGPQKVLVG